MIKPDCIQKPAKPTQQNYVPPNATSYKVLDGDDWAGCAAKVKLTAWELIRFNYPTLPPNEHAAAKEVNWYLQNYVGCKRLTADQRNYIFTSTAQPGIIYLPTKPAKTPAGGAPAKSPALSGPLSGASIATFLTSSRAVNRINFSFPGASLTYKVYPSAYQIDVADAFRSGAIAIKTTGASPGAGATYDNASDELRVGSSFGLTSVINEALLVHECTHAHLDIQNLGDHSRYEGEAVGYLAEAIYLQASGSGPMVGSGDLMIDMVRSKSQIIANKILSGSYAVSAGDAADLTNMISISLHYGLDKKKIHLSNGFDRTWREWMRNL